MEKEKWIQEVLQCADKLERAQPSPFLTDKIMTRVKSEPDRPREGYSMKWALGLAALLIVVINIVSLGKLVQDKKDPVKVAIQTGMGINNEVIYNY